jgi:elongation factor Tu
MTIEDVFSIRGRGTVVTGHIEGGTVGAGDTVEIRGELYWEKALIVGVEMFQKQVDRAGAGDHVGLILHEVPKDVLRRGDVLAGAEYELESE